MSGISAIHTEPRLTADSDPIVGIDLGTTNSLVAYCGPAGPRVLGGGAGGALVPSVVRVRPDGGMSAGIGPRRERHLYPEATISSAKRLLGRSAGEVGEFARGFSVPVVAGPRGIAAFSAHGRTITPHEIGAEVLRELKRVAEADLGLEVRRAVVTVPAYFDDAQRQATRDAARLAGLEVARIVNEPTAAALAYGFGQSRRSERIAVYDLGGGTFDVTILDIVPGATAGTGADCFQVLATAGDTALGGDDIDRAIVDHWIRAMPPLAALQRAALVDAAERVKIELFDRESATATITGLEDPPSLGLDRAELDAIAAPLVARTIDACTRALRDAQCRPGEVDRVVLVGGSSRLRAVRDAVRSAFGSEPYAALDPDRVVALGAAVQAAIVAGGRRDMLLLDVIPLSLGIETVGGTMAKLVMRNSPIPTRASEKFSTSKDGQTSVRIHVLQGERELAEHCRSLGTFDLRGIPPMPAGIPQLEVVFSIDQNGVLGVSAVEKRSGREASIQVVPSYGLTQDEVERIERESVEHARLDMTLHRIIDLRVHSELDLKWIAEALARVRLGLDGAYIAELEASMAAVRTLCESAARDPGSVDPDAFHAAKQGLDRLSMRVHEVAIAQTLRG